MHVYEISAGLLNCIIMTYDAFGSHWKEGDLVLKKATEYGAVEIWMNERVRRACANSCADFVYGFLEVTIFLYHCLTCMGQLKKVFSVASFNILVFVIMINPNVFTNYL
jgi:hypothetical protein